MNTLLIVTMAIVYTVSLVMTRKAISRQYETEWDTINPDVSDLLITFLPVFNTLALFVFWSANRTSRTSKTINKFFKVKER